MIEILIIAVLLCWSIVVVFKKLLPKTAHAFFLKLSQWCAQKNYMTLAKWLQPKMASGCAGGCDCPSNKSSTPIQTVKWK